MNTIESIYRYPVKGFPGESLNDVHLFENEGVPGDRAIGLSSGAIDVNELGEWTACQAFQRMSIRPDLTTFSIEDDRIFSRNNKVANLGSINDVFGDEAKIYHASNNRGYWDHKDAAVSIINLNTVESIAKVLGQDVDPLRFRANIYIRAEAWSEFTWLGQGIDVEGLILDVIRPIDRCNTTSVDVKTGLLDINMPSVLMRHFGHMFCGVYASVKQSGTITSGDAFTVLNHVSSEQMIDAKDQKTAPNITDWPRPAKIVGIENEANGIKSFFIEDSLSTIGSLTDYKAGQYIRVHNLSSTQEWRSYTLSEVKDDVLRITVKRDSGVGSQAIHQLQENETIVISGPFGDASLQQSSKEIHLISAGIGITPTVAKLTSLYEEGYKYPINIIHVARSFSELALWDEVEEVTNKCVNAEISLYLTSTDEMIDKPSLEVGYGRPNFNELAQQVKTSQADVHLCGPESFIASVLDALAEAGISEERIFIDRFASPGLEIDMREIPSLTKPVKVTLSLSNITSYWKPEDGTLLDFVEAKGGVPPSHCRAGVCKTCQCKILSGSATRLIGEEGDDQSQTLLCSSIPKNTLVLEI